MGTTKAANAGETANTGPFGLSDLCALMGMDKPALERFLAPLRDVREDGIYPRPQTELDVGRALDPPIILAGAAPGWEDAPLVLAKFGHEVADLPLPFRWSQLLEFFDCEGDAAWAVERKLTDDPGRSDVRPPINEAAFRRLQSRCPALAALVRPLLEAGAGESTWWRVVAAVSAGDLPRPAAKVAAETTLERQQRRLHRMRELGGDYVKYGDGWRAVGRGILASLAREEAAAGRPMAGRQDVSRDLKAAAVAEGMAGESRG